MRGLRAILVAGALVACGDNQFPIDIVGPQALDAYCEHATTCGLYRDKNDCLFEVHLVDLQLLPRVKTLQDPQIAAAIAAGKLTYDASRAAACIDQIAGLSCSRASEDLRVDPPACAAMFAGAIALGSACDFDDECASGRCGPPAQCPDDYSCCPGVCVTAAHAVGSGGACSVDEDCELGDSCTGSGCAPLIGSGQECSSSNSCAFGLLCASPGIGQGGTCVTAPTIGQPCAMGQCGDIGARCDGSSGMCVALGLPGEPCATEIECGEDEVCTAGSAGSAGSAMTCAPAPALGEPCVDTCLPGSWCDPNTAGGQCVAPIANTTMCTDPLQCQSGYCADGQFAETCIDEPVCI
jgi:hypothetical protein